MHLLATITIALALASGSAFAQNAAAAPDVANAADEDLDIAPTAPASANQASLGDRSEFCFFAGVPPGDVQYEVVRRLKVGKGTYGGVKELLPRLTDQAMASGANAMINYTGSQRFGFWPWRMVRPVVRGDAVKWKTPPKSDCNSMGGTTYKTIFETDAAPATANQVR